jgi:hypothetical protein
MLRDFLQYFFEVETGVEWPSQHRSWCLWHREQRFAHVVGRDPRTITPKRYALQREE